jgi:hypothetical protein
METDLNDGGLEDDFSQGFRLREKLHVPEL